MRLFVLFLFFLNVHGDSNVLHLSHSTPTGITLSCRINNQGSILSSQIEWKGSKRNIDSENLPKLKKYFPPECTNPCPKGPPGPNGKKGRRGHRGHVGPSGKDGLPGIPGVDGPDGLQGAKGQDGTQGLAGPKGPVGLQGAQGPRGAPGRPGRDGRDQHQLHPTSCSHLQHIRRSTATNTVNIFVCNSANVQVDVGIANSDK